MASAPALALVLAGTPGAALAQPAGSVQDFRLPPSSPTPSPTPTAAGPVDRDHPVAAPTRSAEQPAPVPTVAPPPPAVTASAAAAPAPEPRATPAPRAERTAAPAPVPSAAPAAPTALPSASPIVSESPAPLSSASASAPTPTAAPAAPVSTWHWVAGGLALAALLGGFLFWRRRSETAEQPDYEPVAERASAPEPSPPATLPKPSTLNPPQPRREPPPPPAAPSPLPAPAFAPRPLEMQLEARHLSRAMVNASLAYRLTLTNRTGAPAGPLRIAGDIVSAHASLSAQAQLDPGEADLATIHELAALAPGESATLSGELRLPLASILPMQSGGARVFVPLARFRAETADGEATTRVFVIGQISEQPGGALRPFPLDRGPGVDRAIGQRELPTIEEGVSA